MVALHHKELEIMKNDNLDQLWIKECEQKVLEARTKNSKKGKKPQTKGYLDRIIYKSGSSNLFQDILNVRCSNLYKLHDADKTELPPSEFYIVTHRNKKVFSSLCCSCKSHDQKKHNNSIRSKAQRLVKGGKGLDKRKNFALEDGITFEQILNKYLEQKGRCYYSSIRLNWQRDTHWMISLERLDRTKGHTNENTVLCCFEFNNAIQWKREYFNEYLQ